MKGYTNLLNQYMLTVSFECRRKGTAQSVLSIMWAHIYNGDNIPKVKGEPIKAKTLSTMLSVSLPTIYTAINFLIKKGFLRKEGRTIIVESQEKVIELYCGQVSEVKEERQEKKDEDLTPEERQEKKDALVWALTEADLTPEEKKEKRDEFVKFMLSEPPPPQEEREKLAEIQAREEEEKWEQTKMLPENREKRLALEQERARKNREKIDKEGEEAMKILWKKKQGLDAVMAKYAEEDRKERERLGIRENEYVLW